MVVENHVKEKTKEILIGMFGEDTASLIDYAFECNILDINKCRIALIKRYYHEQLRNYTATESKIRTAEQFCIAEKTVENLIYNSYYKSIIV